MHIKQILTDIKGEIDSNTTIVGHFNTPLTSTDRSTSQKINKETVALNETLHQKDLTDINRTFIFLTECTFFSSGTFSRLDHMLGQKINLNKSYQTSFLITTV